MIYCMKCGSKLPDDAKFCKYCGSSTATSEETENNSLNTYSSPVVEKETKPTLKPQVEVEIKSSPKVEVKIISTDVEPIYTRRAEVETQSPQAEPLSRYPHSIDAAARYPHATEVETRYPRRPELETRYPHRTETEPKIPPRVEKVEHDIFDRPIKETAVNPYDRSRRKADNYYIDNEFHSGLARKNIGGVYNEVLDSMVGGKWGFVDTARKDIIPVIYDKAFAFENGFAKVWMNGKCGILNKKGAEVVPLLYSDVAYPSEGMTGVCLNGKWGFIDAKGKKTTSFKYSNITPFENGMAGVCKNGKWGMIDKNDRIVVSFMYTDPSQFENEKKAGKKIKPERQPRNAKLLYDFTIGISRAWFAFFGELFVLFVVNRVTPPEKNMAYWMIIAITVVISFVLFFTMIGSIKSQIRKYTTT